MSDQARKFLHDYVIGEADPEHRDAVELRARQDPGYRAELEGLQEIASLLSDMPPDAWPQSSYMTIEASPPREPVARERRWFTGGWARRMATGAASACLLLGGIAIGIAIERGGGDHNHRAILLEPLHGPSADAAVARASTERISLKVTHLPALAAGRYYELWLMNSKTSLVALASFRVAKNGTAAIEVPLPVDTASFRYLDISVQSVTGGAGHSNDSVLRGPSPSSDAAS